MKDSQNKPDFLLAKNKKKIYVEAKIEYNLSDKLQKERNSKDHLLDSINRIKSNKYRIVLLTKERLSENQPSIKGFRKCLEKQFSKLDYVKVKELTQKGIQFLETHKYKDNDLYIKYKIIRVEKGYSDNRLIQMGDGSSAKSMDCQTSLRNSLNEKVKDMEE